MTRIPRENNSATTASVTLTGLPFSATATPVVVKYQEGRRHQEYEDEEEDNELKTVMRSLVEVDDSRRREESPQEEDVDRRLSQRIYQEIHDEDQSQHHLVMQKDEKEDPYNGSTFSEEYRGEHDPLVSCSGEASSRGMTEPDVALSSTLGRDMTQSDATQLLNERISRRRRLREELRRRQEEHRQMQMMQPSCSNGLSSSSFQRNLLPSSSQYRHHNQSSSPFAKSSGRSSDQEPIYHSMSPSSSHASEDYEDIH